MLKHKILIFLALTVLFGIKNYAQGLLFHANDELISKRTAYTVFTEKPPRFDDSLKISFDLSVLDVNSFGYICYIQEPHSNDLYSLTLSNEGANVLFKLNIVGKQSLIQAPVNKNNLGFRRWQRLSLLFDSRAKRISLVVNRQAYHSKELLGGSSFFSPSIIFGKHDSYVDVPKIAIRDLKIEGSNKKIAFHFDENVGNVVHATDGKQYGYIENPDWLINDSYAWKLQCKKYLSKPAVVSFNVQDQSFIILDADSAFIFSLNQKNTSSVRYKDTWALETRLGNSFIDSQNHKLYVYEVNNLPVNSNSISALDLQTYQWQKISSRQLPQQHHHHSSFFDPSLKEFTLFGGFGNQRYFNSFETYDIRKDEWVTRKFSGDIIHPRFYSGQAQINSHQTILFGGIGNQSGDQTLGRNYSYDCYLVDYSRKTVKKLWEIPLSKTGLVTVRNMIQAENPDYFYTLCYPEYIPNTYLRLYKFSIKDGKYEILGDSIPFISERIESNANLYYNEQTHELFCTTQVFAPNGSSVVKIYSIASPPVAKEYISAANAHGLEMKKWIPWVLVPIVLLLIILFPTFRMKRKADKRKKQVMEKLKGLEQAPTLPMPNSLYVFGDFKVMDSHNRDIAHLFSPKVKQLFLYILFIGIENGEGVDSQEIHTAIWPDKTPENAKNLKGVALNQIRKILADMLGIQLVYKNGYFKFDLDDQFYFDYLDFMRLTNKSTAELIDEQTIQQIASITARGIFLKSVDFPPIVRIKLLLENKMRNIFMPALIQSYREHKYMLAIHLSKILNQIEENDEEAFRYEVESYLKLGIMDAARKRYNEFAGNPSLERPGNLPASFIEYVDNKTFRIK
ncbi:MAG: hypothetical protein BGN96_12125 [Bacteroidales bacterium 45-6]|nr:MAG: hypothetical protein BGN96_12125 [Bacteroidales bacterium 45-6]